MAKPYMEGSSWSVRIRVGGRDEYRTGFSKSKEAAAYAAAFAKSLRDEGKPQGKGPNKTFLAEALSKKALEKLPTMKGAVQEGNRVNRYLRLAGLPILKVTPTGNDTGQLFEVVLERPSGGRTVPSGLEDHRKALVTKSAKSEDLRSGLALTMMSEVTRYGIQTFMNRLREEGSEPATLDQERGADRVAAPRRSEAAPPT